MMKVRNQKGIGHSGLGAANYALLIEGLREMDAGWNDVYEFKIEKALEALTHILSCIRPELQTVLHRANDGIVTRDNAAIEQLMALEAALRDIKRGRSHPELVPTKVGGTNILRADQLQMQEAIASSLGVVKSCLDISTDQSAAKYMAQNKMVHYNGKIQNQNQIIAMTHRLRKR